MAASVFAHLAVARPAKPTEPSEQFGTVGFPDVLAYLLAWFDQITLGIASNGWSPAIVTWEGLKAWCEMTRNELEPWEAVALIRLGRINAAAEAEASKKPNAKGR